MNKKKKKAIRFINTKQKQSKQTLLKTHYLKSVNRNICLEKIKEEAFTYKTTQDQITSLVVGEGGINPNFRLIVKFQQCNKCMSTDDLNTFQDTLGLINTKSKRSSSVRHGDHISMNCDRYWITVNKNPNTICYYLSMLSQTSFSHSQVSLNEPVSLPLPASFFPSEQMIMSTLWQLCFDMQLRHTVKIHKRYIQQIFACLDMVKAAKPAVLWRKSLPFPGTL